MLTFWITIGWANGVDGDKSVAYFKINEEL